MTPQPAGKPARKKVGGWLSLAERPRDAEGRPLCRWCALAVPKGRRTFCSDKCVHDWKLRTDPGYLREAVFARDRGVCAKCNTDTTSLRRDMKKLDYAARKKFLKDWGLKEGHRKSLWDADHVVPVAEGGGECDLANMRTLCLRCHRVETRLLIERLRSVVAAIS